MVETLERYFDERRIHIGPHHAPAGRPATPATGPDVRAAAR
jgi:hypothetical protein